LLEGYRHHRHPKPRARLRDGYELDVALAVTVQRLRPTLVGCGDLYSGGLDDGSVYSRGQCQSPETRAGLWLHDGVGDDDEEEEEEEEEFY
jgi:hypothetical protein